MPTAPDDIPERIGRYRIGGPLGQGGFAIVLKAHDEGLDADVAIKILDTERAFDPDLRERFVREARLLRRVQNPHVVAVFDIGELDDGRPYFVMEFAAGSVVRERFSGGRPSSADLQTIVVALRSGLGALHRAGIVHRDIKPDNLLIAGAEHQSDTRVGADRLDDTERIIIGDLGLAKDQLITGAGPTILGGTPRFRAPEQLDDSAAITPATDTFAASGVLWQVRTGSLPPEDLEADIHHVSDGWAAFFRQGLARAPLDRFESIDQWAEAALAVVDHHDASSSTAAHSTTSVAVGVCPYKGLAAYQPSDAALFFGREALVDELIRRLQMLPTLVVAGPSGSGKSSVVRAGLVPAVERGALSGSQEWPVALMTPGLDPLRELHRQLDHLLSGPLPSIEELTEDPTTIRSAIGPGGALLVIDQFEEVFTAPTDQIGTTVRLLAELTRPEHEVRLVLALRADFYDRCAAHPWLAQVINDNQVLVGPMQRSELRRAIEAPARRAGLRFETGVVDRILDDAGSEAGSLPLVAHSLMETWLRRRGNELTLGGYEAAGGVAGAIAQSTETTFARLDPAAAETSSHLFLRLVNPGDDNVITRRRLSRDDIDEQERTVIDEWAQARLLTVDEDGIEITHEAMLATWPRLRQWIEESRDDLRTRQRIARAAESWHSEQRDPALLYRGTPLEAAMAWLEEHPHDLGRESQEFLDASAAERDREAEARAAAGQRQQRRRRLAVGALAVLAVAALVASVLAVIALAQSRQDEERAVEAEADANLRFAELVAGQPTEGDPLLGVMLAAEAIARAPRPPVGAMASLIESRQLVAESGPVPLGGPIPVDGALRVDLSDDGTQFVVGTRSGVIEIGATDHPDTRSALAGHTDGIEGVVFAPSGEQLASGGLDGRIVVWDLTAAEPTANTLAELDSLVWDVAYNSTGDRLAAVTENGQLVVLDPSSGDEVARFDAGPAVDLLSVAFGPDDDLIVAGSGRGEVWGWRLGAGEPAFDPIPAHTSDVWELVFAPSGDRLMTVSSDFRVLLWDVATQDQLSEPLTQDGVRLVDAKGAVWLPDDTIVVGGADGSVWQIDLTGAVEPAPVIDGFHGDLVLDLATSADGTRLVSVADDQSVRLIDNMTRQPVTEPIVDLGAPGFSLAVNPSGTRLAAGAADGALTIVGTDGTDAVTVDGLDGRISAIAFVDDNTVVAGDQAGGLHLISGGAITTSIDAHPQSINALAVDPGGSTIVTVGEDGSSRAWDSADLTATAEAAPVGPVPTSVAFVDDNDVLIGFRQGDVRRWSLDGDPGDAVSVDIDTIWHIAYDPIHERVAFSTGSELVLVHAITDLDESLARLSDFGNGATSSTFLGDGDTVAAVSRDGELRHLDVASGLAVGPPLQVHPDQAWAIVSRDPTGHVTYTVGGDGLIARTDVLDLETACRLAIGAFDMARRDTYLGDTESAACPSA
ncbi:MAG: protein kinase domain-containing protein [Acidimicrobiales bacterium]